MHFSPRKEPNLLSLQKNIFALALIFLSRGITPLVSAEVRFGCRDRAGSRNSNLIPFQAGLILSLLVCVMPGPIAPLHYHNAAELTMIFHCTGRKTGPQKFCNMLCRIL